MTQNPCSVHIIPDPDQDLGARIGLAELLGDLPCPRLPDELHPVHAWGRLECIDDNGELAWAPLASSHLPFRVASTLVDRYRRQLHEHHPWQHLSGGSATLPLPVPDVATPPEPFLDLIEVQVPPAAMRLTGRYVLLIMDEVNEESTVQPVAHTWMVQGMSALETTAILDSGAIDLDLLFAEDEDGEEDDPIRSVDRSELPLVGRPSATTLGALLPGFSFPPVFDMLKDLDDVRIDSVLALVRAEHEVDGRTEQRWFQRWTEGASSSAMAGILARHVESFRSGNRHALIDSMQATTPTTDHPESEDPEPSDDLLDVSGLPEMPGNIHSWTSPLSDHLDEKTGALQCLALPEGWTATAAILIPRIQLRDHYVEEALSFGGQNLEQQGESFCISPLEIQGLLTTTLHDILEQNHLAFAPVLNEAGPGWPGHEPA